jgi:hypothetical protein
MQPTAAYRPSRVAATFEAAEDEQEWDLDSLGCRGREKDPMAGEPMARVSRRQCVFVDAGRRAARVSEKISDLRSWDAAAARESDC